MVIEEDKICQICSLNILEHTINWKGKNYYLKNRIERYLRYNHTYRSKVTPWLIKKKTNRKNIVRKKQYRTVKTKQHEPH